MRVFWAVPLPKRIKASLAEVQEAVRRAVPEARVSWTRADGLHVTLKFLGDVDDPEPLIEAVDRSLPRQGAFQMELQGAGCFGGKKPKVLWAGLGEPGRDRLRALAQAVEQAMEPLGVAREKRGYKPHVTLGRARPGGKLQVARDLMLTMENTELPPGLTFEVREVVLYESHLVPGKKAEYRPLVHLALDPVATSET